MPPRKKSKADAREATPAPETQPVAADEAAAAPENGVADAGPSGAKPRAQLPAPQVNADTLPIEDDDVMVEDVQRPIPETVDLEREEMAPQPEPQPQAEPATQEVQIKVVRKTSIESKTFSAMDYDAIRGSLRAETQVEKLRIYKLTEDGTNLVVAPVETGADLNGEGVVYCLANAAITLKRSDGPEATIPTVINKPMGNYIATICKHWQVDPSAFRYIYDGVRLNTQLTLIEFMHLHAVDEMPIKIDVAVEQLGGC
ncbi:hypothetical protein HXX76_014099 [Chlamydomonas incerta]|uniref:Ubiquitin-like domain-containing protein n=1 Tax=Chlamydomonas incerta TaxID=51695 RepID=A0A835SS72_CHLIN|nr:hypothetical protein HXX76_014099 [Chlamydomonas incerta]|eukprot:KAG2424941.1 hypothetical protein HXX76_014099 [Chlamydomonas incerta]